jgi:hypothetical protein
MAQLLVTDHKKYVPSYTDSNGDNVILESVGLHGDKLFEERARCTQWTFQDGDTFSDRLQGLDTEFAEWHAKYNLFKVCYHIFCIKGRSSIILQEGV